MACGLPIILSDHSSVNEVLCGGNGMFYHSESVLDLVDKMEKMIVGKRREVMSSEARKFAENNDWHHISDRFLELIEQ
jgi:glycosyltransferase involved in cell wall biosynthesis